MTHLILLIAGLILLYFSVYTFRKSLNYLKAAGRATGTVIELKETRYFEDRDYKFDYQPVFSFKVEDGSEFTYIHSTSSSKPVFKVGETALIAYDRENPKDARLVSYYGMFLIPLLFALPAVLLIVIGGSYCLSVLFLR